jgi:hypothetical protein
MVLESVGLPATCVTPIDATPVWLFCLTGLFFALCYFALNSAERVLAFWAFARRARRAGYPRSSCLVAAWDRGPKTGDLLSGMGLFALLGADLRDTFWLTRYRAEVVSLLLLLAAPLVPVLFLLGWLPWNAGSSNTWLATGELLLFTVPVLLALLILRWLLTRERKSRTRFGDTAETSTGSRRGSILRARSWRRASLPRPELVETWRRQGGDDASKAGGGLLGRIIPWATLAAPTMSVAVVFVFLGGSFFFSLWTSVTLREMASSWLEFVQSPFTENAQWAALDSALFDISGDIADPSLNRVAILDSLSEAAAMDAGPLRTDEEFRARRLRLWTEYARAAAAIPPGPHLLRVPQLSGDLLDPVNRNAVIARRSLERGDTADFVRRSLQQIGAGRHILGHSGSSFDVRAVRKIRESLMALSEIASGAEARHLRDLADQLGLNLTDHRLFAVGFDEVLMVDPAYPIVSGFLGNVRLAPSVRVRLARVTLTGLCGNGREMLLGMTEARLSLFDDAVQSLSDLPSEVTDGLSDFRDDFLRTFDARGGIRSLGPRLAACDGYWVD